MKLVIIADTHCQHEALGTLAGDVLIHCGDLFDLTCEPDDALAQIDDWFARQDFKLILCTGGNHDITLEQALEQNAQPFRHAHYLQDERIEYSGLVFHGAPWTPLLEDHAFYKSSRDIKKSWAKIPGDVDVLITHTPPENILDRSSHGAGFGCPYLADAVRKCVPRLHCFGHVHASAGTLENGNTQFINASCVNSRLEVVSAPYVVNL